MRQGPVEKQIGRAKKSLPHKLPPQKLCCSSLACTAFLLIAAGEYSCTFVRSADSEDAICCLN